MEATEGKHSFDLNETINISDHEDEVNQQSQIGKDLSMLTQNLTGMEPIIGTNFQTEDEAYNSYNAYARSVGFSIRKDKITKRADNVITKRVICCSKQGFRRKHPRGSPLKPQAHKITNCEARIVIKIQIDGTYYVSEFVQDHNHELVPPSQRHILRSQRKISKSQAELMDSMDMAGIGPTQMYSYFCAEAGGSQNVNFIKTDCKNRVQRKHNDYLKKGDAQLLFEFFRQKQKENPNFFYSIQTDENNQLCSCFWSDAKSRIDYSFFGDVICFDTTYKTNGYDKPFAPFVGVNNHGQTILFGGALLEDETTESFIWLFRTFIDAMNGKQPKTIFTDQAAAIGNAIKHVFVDAHHRLCLWHIFQNAAKHFSSIFHKYDSFSKDFKSCIYDHEQEEEFHSSWAAMLKNYNLEDNDWLNNLYKIREKWAQVYGREHFCAGMTTTQRSESINSYFKGKYFKSTTLRKFIVEYEKAVTNQRDQELVEDYDSRQTKPVLKSLWKAEANAAERYTRKTFALFQADYMCCLNLFEELICESGTISTYRVSSVVRARARTVAFDSSDNTVKCSCKTFEFTGILCPHALKILMRWQFSDLPSHYYLNRWTKDATHGVVVDAFGESMQIDRCPSLTLRYSELAHIALTLAVKGANTQCFSAFAKGVLNRAMTELDCFIKSKPSKDTSSETLNHDNTGQEENTRQITIRDPPRKKGQTKRRFKCPLEGKSDKKIQK